MQDFDKDEELMTDLQFLEYKRIRDELEAASEKSRRFALMEAPPIPIA